MRLEILTPEQQVFEGDVTIATFPGADGSFQVMDHHAPLISLLTSGPVEYKVGSILERIIITGGVVEVLNNKTVVLADGVVRQ